MEKKDKEYGIVYLLTNECMPGLVKIGMTSRADLDTRLKELYTTGVPMPFECAYACKIQLDCMPELENALHQAFAPQRVNDNREFFRIKPEQAIPVMKVVTHLQDADVTAEVAAEIANDLNDQDKVAIAKAKKNRRPPLDFGEMGLIGQVLIFTEDTSKTCIVDSNKKVEYEDELYSLTRLTMLLLHKAPDAYNVQPTPFWKTSDGKNLSEIYNETYPFEDE